MYHNPRCSTCRNTLALLREAGEEPEIVEYLKTPLSADELDSLCRKIGIEPHELLRFKETRASELGLKREDRRSRREWLKLLAENPVLIERPIVVKGDAARVCRPAESVKELL
jgi:arsenate reductase